MTTSQLSRVLVASLAVASFGTVRPLDAQTVAPAKPWPAKKLISHGWSDPDTMCVREHWQEMEQMPFQGTAIKVAINREAWKQGTRDTGNQLGWATFNNVKLNAASFEPAIADLNAAHWSRFTDNFIAVSVASSGQDHGFDWFDDARWETVLHNWSIVASIAKRGGLKGIIIDPEQYKAYLFRYADMHQRHEASFADYQAQVRRRGRQLMEMVSGIYPDATLLWLFGHSHLALQRKEASESEYGLLVSLIDGMIEAAGPARFHLIDELAYGWKEKRQFLIGYHATLHGALRFAANPDAYRAKMRSGFGLMLDYVKPWNPADISGHHFSPNAFAEALKAALEVTDEYVWVYSMAPRFFPPKDLPTPYLEAIHACQPPQNP